MIVTTATDEASVVFEPQDRFDNACVALVELLNFLILPEAVHIDVTLIVVHGVHMATVGELDLGTASDHQPGKLVSRLDIIKMKSIDSNTVEVSDHHIEAARVDCNGLNDILELLD